MRTDNVINIGFNCSNEYAYITGVAIASILKYANPEDQFNIVIIHKDIPEYKQELIKQLAEIKKCNIEFRKIEVKDFLDYRNKNECYEASNYRLRLASLCPEFDRIIFLDSDVLVLQSLRTLWKTDMTNYHMACVVDPFVKAHYNYTIADKERFPNKRFNTGVMLCNLKKWREDKSELQLKQDFLWYTSKYNLTPDQEALNVAFKDTILELDAVYNCMGPVYMKGNCDEPKIWEKALENPVIMHYAGVWERPWVTPGAYGCAQWWHVARQTPFYEGLLAYASDYKGLYMVQDICHKLPYIVSKNKILFFYYVLNVLYRILPIQIIKNQRDRYRHKRHILKTIMKDEHACHVYHHYY